MRTASFLSRLADAHHDDLVLASRLLRAAHRGDDAEAWADAVLEHYQRRLSLAFALEEQQVMPLLEHEAPRLARQMRDEHAELTQLVTRIATALPRWGGLLETFAEQLAAHVRFEDRISFPLARRAEARRAAAIATFPPSPPSLPAAPAA